MKKIILSIIFILGIINLVLSAPNNTINIPHSFSPNTTIASGESNSNNNEIQTKFNAHTHTDLTALGVITSGTWQATAIDELYGGTGITTYTTGDMLYSSASNTLSKLGIGSASQHLIISGGIPAWSNAVDINSGTIDGVTIGGSVAPTTTNIGTIAAGTWNGTDIAAGYGGIGSNKIDSGTVALAAQTDTPVNFAFTFGSAPKVVTGIEYTYGVADFPTKICQFKSVTTTGFSAWNAEDSKTVTMHWIAFGQE